MFKYTFLKSNNRFHSSSAMRRLVTAFVIVMSFLCVFIDKCTVYADYLYKPVDAHITFTCQGIEGINGGKYQISIKAGSVEGPLPAKDIITVDENGKGEFVLHITEPGTYDYQVYQIKGSDKDVIYDETKYDVHVFVTSNENGMLEYTVAVNISNTDQKPDAVEFKNAAVEIPTENKLVPPDKSVETGDDFGPGLILLMLLTAMVGIAVILIHKRSSKES